MPLHGYDMMHDKWYQKAKQAQVAWVPFTIQVRGQYWTTVQRTGKLTTEDSYNIPQVFFSHPPTVSAYPNQSLHNPAFS